MKSAIWQLLDLYPSGMSAKDRQFRFENSSYPYGKSPGRFQGLLWRVRPGWKKYIWFLDKGGTEVPKYNAIWDFAILSNFPNPAFRAPLRNFSHKRCPLFLNSVIQVGVSRYSHRSPHPPNGYRSSTGWDNNTLWRTVVAYTNIPRSANKEPKVYD